MKDLTEHEVHRIERSPRCHSCGMPLTAQHNAPLRCTNPVCAVSEWWDNVHAGELYADRSDFDRRFDIPLDDGLVPAHGVAAAVFLGFAAIAASVAAVVWAVSR